MQRLRRHKERARNIHRVLAALSRVLSLLPFRAFRKGLSLLATERNKPGTKRGRHTTQRNSDSRLDLRPTWMATADAQLPRRPYFFSRSTTAVIRPAL